MTREDSLASTSHNIVAGDWAQVEIINLVNDGSGLGFGNYYKLISLLLTVNSAVAFFKMFIN